MNEWMNEEMDGCMSGWMDRCVNEEMDGCIMSG